ncbi:MAG: hypothetical protein AB1529_07025 [Candidatus Micrarchaeota archaeon]
MEYKHAIFALLLVSLSSAALNLSEVRMDGLEAAMDNVECKTDFMVGVIESVMENTGEDLQDDINMLEADTDTLQGYADAGDVAAFRSYVHGTYAPDMRETRLDVLEARRGALMNASAREAMREDYDELHGTYVSCNLDSLRRFGNARLQGYEQVLERAQEKADDLSGKGVDTSGLDSLIAEAKEEVTEPLSEALDEAQNGTDVREAIMAYCLFNGCKDGTNFHFAVKFEAEKLGSILEFIADDAEAAGLGDDVDSAQADIDAAEATIEAAGTSQYPEGEGKQILDDLKDAARTIKEIVSALRSG